ncbi:hypothetical protein GQ55_1G128600 [Panicum hallii var. hallii]|uniref:Uncharacterized protein n=1 Tax=Panicum hallii var. hallii TaxID=1504633 RepID=A0A2T7F510_9POAL|nr:hypothetical protein GQ55_1G128600 [Panicum hallii var. hallii]
MRLRPRGHTMRLDQRDTRPKQGSREMETQGKIMRLPSPEGGNKTSKL